MCKNGQTFEIFIPQTNVMHSSIQNSHFFGLTAWKCVGCNLTVKEKFYTILHKVLENHVPRTIKITLC